MNMDSKDKHQVGKNHHLYQAMAHATAGIVAMVREERNMRFHVLAAVVALLLGWWFRISSNDWLWLLLVNVDVKKAKDVAAGGVLLAACFAVVVGLIIFGPHLVDLVR